MIKVGIVEDNSTLRNSLENLFNRTDGMKCVVSLNNLMNVVSEVGKALPDVVLMDIGLPNISGIEGVRTVKSNFPKIQAMMFTVFDDDEKIFDAIRAGASGYLLKRTPPEEIVQAIRDLYHGGAPMTASIARKVIQSFQGAPSTVVEDYRLTVRENEILYSLVDGLSYKKIADKYCVSISTIRTHICNIYNKLHVNSKAEAVAKVLGPSKPSSRRV
ncbi:MAG: response regulator transcription factor [Bacteroidota bacterium]|nr:response regulator transcription factor [Bacteroidota bacterium]MDP4218415.1 response regulator transcription factor [Bacteroidota bacterium]MDP4245487.1 response regulator transcription factor [Bacteroidota bacterium]MDP4253690.1 response regulator transcription factor [Bacteroidota bacterium]MDP4259974.1 response regulator transcription factor [Bacteroidota bacterium]